MTAKAGYDASESILGAKSGYHIGDLNEMIPDRIDRIDRKESSQNRWESLGGRENKKSPQARPIPTAQLDDGVQQNAVQSQ